MSIKASPEFSCGLRGGCWGVAPQYARIVVPYDSFPHDFRSLYVALRLVRRVS